MTCLGLIAGTGFPLKDTSGIAWLLDVYFQPLISIAWIETILCKGIYPVVALELMTEVSYDIFKS